METIILINIPPRESRLRSAIESQAAFDIEAREERITTVEEFEEFRLAGMCDSRAPEVVCYQRAIIFLSNL
jgi:hypothetical protein